MSELFDKLRLIYEAALETFWPTRCTGCDLPGTLLCEDCQSKLSIIDQRLACPYCGAPFGYQLCTECFDISDSHTNLENVALLSKYAHLHTRAFCLYDDLAQQIIHAYKDECERRLAPVIASFLIELLHGDSSQEDWARNFDGIVILPSNPHNLKKRGFNHMKLIGDICSKELAVPLYQPFVFSDVVHDQRELSAEERRNNIQESLSLRQSEISLPDKVIIIDDVFTTGASISVAADALLNKGVRQVCAAVFARVW